MIERLRLDRASARTQRLAVDLPGAVPGWLVRMAPGLLVLAAGSPAEASLAGAVVLLAVAVAAVLRPGTFAAALLAVVLAVATLVQGSVAFAHGALPVALAVLGVHLVLASGAVARHVAWRGQVDPRVLGEAALGLVPVQVATQLLVILAWVASGGASPVWRTAGVVALVGLGLLVLPARRLPPR